MNRVAGSAVQIEAVRRVPRDDVPQRWRRAADHVAGARARNTTREVRARERARYIRADVIAGDRVGTARRDQDSVAHEPVDDEPAHDRVSGCDVQTRSCLARIGAHQLDHRRTGEIRFAGAVNDHRVGDRWKRGLWRDRVRTRTGDVKSNGVDGASARVRVQDRLPE